jgi:hypothetical protein
LKVCKNYKKTIITFAYERNRFLLQVISRLQHLKASLFVKKLGRNFEKVGEVNDKLRGGICFKEL